MAHGRPWYQRNGGDFLMATISFPDVETRWVYSAIVDMLNDRDRPIADDAKFITGFTGLSLKKWSIARKYLLEGGYLVLNQDGQLTNPRFEREKAARDAKKATNAANGRKGGLKSAAGRGQGELGLDGQETVQSTPESRGESTPESTPESATNPPAKVGTGSQENNDLGEANAQASRARERASEARGERRSIESTTANPRNRAGADADDADEDPRDVLGIVNRLCRIGGVAVTRPTDIAREVEFVRQWLRAGYDIEETVVPAITEQFTNTNVDTIGSLNFYSARVAKLHAQQVRKKTAANGKDHSIAKPIYMFEDEDSRMASLRHDLFQALGDWAYATWLNNIRLVPEDDAPAGKHPLRFLPRNGRPTQQLFDGERRSIIAKTLRTHGFTDAW